MGVRDRFWTVRGRHNVSRETYVAALVNRLMHCCERGFFVTFHQFQSFLPLCLLF